MNFKIYLSKWQFRLDERRFNSILYTMYRYYDVLTDEEWQSHCNSLIMVVSSLRTLRDRSKNERNKKSLEPN